MTEEEVEGCSVRVSPLTSPQLSRQLSLVVVGLRAALQKKDADPMQPPLTPTPLTSPPPPSALPTLPFHPVPYTHPNSRKRGCARTPPPPLQPQPRFAPTAASKRTKGKASDSIQGSGAASVAGQPSVCKARKPSQLDSINDFLCCFLAH